MKKLLAKLINWIDGLFNKLSPEVRRAIAISVLAVEGLKKAIDSPVVDILTLIIPGTKDDVLVMKARRTLAFVLEDLNLVQGRFNTANDLVKEAILDLQNTPEGLRAIKLHSIAVELSKRLAGLDFGDAVYLAEYYYKKYVKK